MMSLIVAAGCSTKNGETPESAASAPDSAPTTSTTAGGDSLPCQNMIFSDEDVPQDYEILLDVIALPTSNSVARALHAGRNDGTDPPSYFAKTGLLVRSGAAFTLEVDHPRTVAIRWGSPTDISSTISSQGCPGESWIAFAGGFVIQEPTCVRLTLTSGDQQETFSVGAGAACQGQQPPSPI